MLNDFAQFDAHMLPDHKLRGRLVKLEEDVRYVVHLQLSISGATAATGSRAPVVQARRRSASELDPDLLAPTTALASRRGDLILPWPASAVE